VTSIRRRKAGDPPDEIRPRLGAEDLCAFFRRLLDEVTDGGITQALGVWMGYPRLANDIATYARDPSRRGELWHWLNAAHYEAGRRIMHAAVHAGIDPTRIALSRDICQRVYLRHGGLLVSHPDALWETWPACISDANTELSDDERQAVRGAEADLQQLVAILEVKGEVMQGFDLTPPLSPTEIATMLGCSTKTFRRRFDGGAIRGKRLTSKQYQIALDDLPPNHRAKYRSGTK
jgi:hypothetical protein